MMGYICAEWLAPVTGHISTVVGHRVTQHVDISGCAMRRCRNAAGKTTALRLMTGFLEPSAGVHCMQMQLFFRHRVCHP